jgi:uncharacterized iron-regulated protein
MYSYPVPLGETFDLAQGRVLEPSGQARRLETVRLIFLGEQHTDPRSHQAQLAVLEQIAAQGRPLLVALEMFPPAADAVLEEWRSGKLSEAAFLERSRWYETWGYPFSHYRSVFTWLRDHRIPLRGINADEATRAAVRQGQLESLPPALRAEVGDLDAVLEPHRDYLLDTLRQAGHRGNLDADAQDFRRMLRVQTLWDRLMGGRAARLAESQPGNGAVAVLLGSGHLAYRLGANLQAARVTDLAQLSLWDTTVPRSALDPGGRFPVPVGMADWVRGYRQEEPQPEYPRLSGIKLAAHAQGVRVESVRPGPSAYPLQADDVIVALNGAPAGGTAGLRLDFEALPWDRPAELTILRAGKTLTLTVTPHRD